MEREHAEPFSLKESTFGGSMNRTREVSNGMSVLKLDEVLGVCWFFFWVKDDATLDTQTIAL